MNNDLWIAVDNGLSGALCVSSGQLIIAKSTMFTKAKKKGREIDVVAAWEWIREVVQPHQLQYLLAIVEEPGGAKSYKAAISMSASFHALRAMFELQRIPFLRITPQKWQKQLLKAKSGDTKPAALKLAKTLWPDENWLASKRCLVPHDGLVDAALIGYFAYKHL